MVSRVLSCPPCCTGGRGEHAGRFARPEFPHDHWAGSTVPEVLHRRSHVAEAGGAAERQSNAFREIGGLDIGRAGRPELRFNWRLHTDDNLRHGAQTRRCTPGRTRCRGQSAAQGPARNRDDCSKERESPTSLLYPPYVGRYGFSLASFPGTRRASLCRGEFRPDQRQPRFTTLLSLVPLVAVVLSIVAVVPFFPSMVEQLRTFARAQLPAGAQRRDDHRLHSAVLAASGQGHGRGFAGSCGHGGLMLLLTIERAFNHVWAVRKRAPGGGALRLLPA
jgi:hypothetical protein